LFRHLLLQIGGANIENPPPSSSFAEEERLRSLLLRASARDSRRSQLVFWELLCIALCLLARSARGDIRRGAAVFVGSVGT